LFSGYAGQADCSERSQRRRSLSTPSFLPLGTVQESDGAEHQKRYHGEHHQMPRLKQIKQIPHSGTPRAIVARNSHAAQSAGRAAEF
jgi:hypothetical protein